MKLNLPLISVVIPTLNEEKYLPKCLASLKNQTFKNFEVIIADGGSKDSTIKIANKYGAIVAVIPGSNVTTARQKGIEQAKGEIIVGADADTIYPSNYLEKIIADFKKDEKIIAVGGGGIFERKPWWLYLNWRFVYFLIGQLFQLFGFVLYIPAFNFSFKKNEFLKIGGYNTYLDFGGDELDILERLKKRGKVYFDTKLLVYPSSRRASVGFFQLLIKHTLIDYYLNYLLAKIFKKTIIRGQPVR